ncbi:MAG: Na+/H+ antiporter NhaC family protein [Bacteroidia bacterium]|nr:Na+/H+ antiporter NhaC family protein [Bacteroidia bacterium]
MRYFYTALFLFAGQLFAQTGDGGASADWTSILPPLVAIVLALVLREVLISLTAGIFTGLVLVALSGEGSLGEAFLRIPEVIQKSLFDNDHLSVILFTLMIGAMVSIISKNGGMMALVKRIAKRATTARSGQLATWLLGIAIFFDDYANTLVVGNTMRPLTDRLKISREKLAYIVDSTAAPVAAIAFITTWIGAELGYISDGIAAIENGKAVIGGEYTVFFRSLQYMFYPILTLFFIFLIVWKRVDFGPMLTAERKARSVKTNEDKGGVKDLDSVPDQKEHILSAIVPIAVMILGAVIGLLYTGSQNYAWQVTTEVMTQAPDSFGDYLLVLWRAPGQFMQNLSGIIGGADSYKALIWGSFCGLAVAILITVIPRLLTIKKTMEMAEEGVKSMMPAILILTLAWTLGGLTEELGTASYLAELTKGGIMPQLVPTIVFILSAAIAFSTGTSWGTMSILYPIVLVTSWQICEADGMAVEASLGIFANVVSAVLAGSVLGDHCSPISDTTILSSLSTDCDHIAHVRTQMPYALTVGGVSILLGTLPAGFGIPFYISFPVAGLSLYFIVSYFGKMVDGEGVTG